MNNKKSLIDTVLLQELSQHDKSFCDALESLGMVDSNPTENQLWIWYNDRPSEEDKKKVLRAIGYDI